MPFSPTRRGRRSGSSFPSPWCLPALLIVGLSTWDIRHRLIDARAIDLVRVAPVSSAAVVSVAFGRMILRGLLYAAVLGIPSVLTLCRHFDVHGAAVVVHPFAAALLACPTLAFYLLFQVMLWRFLPGAYGRFFATLIVFGLGGLVILSGLAVMGGGEAAKSWLLSIMVEPPAWLRVLATPAAIVAIVGGVKGTTWPLMSLVVFAAMTAMCLIVAGRLFPRAHENARIGGRSIFIGLRRRIGRRWPRRVVPSVLRRTTIELLQTPSGVLLFAFVAVPMCIFAGDVEPHGLPPTSAGVFHLLLSLWFPMLFIVSAILVASITSEDVRQLALLRTAPVSRRGLLLGRLLGFTIPLLWTVLSAVVVGVVRCDIGLGASVIFVVVAVPVMTMTLTVLGAAGASCSYRRGDGGAEAPDTTAVVVAIIVHGVFMTAGMLAVGRTRSWLFRHRYDDGPLTALSETTACVALVVAVWIVAAVVSFVTWQVAVRGYRRQLGPES